MTRLTYEQRKELLLCLGAFGFRLDPGISAHWFAHVYESYAYELH